MNKRLMAIMILLTLFAASFSTWLFLRQTKLQNSIDHMKHLYTLTYSMNQLQQMTEAMRGPMYHFFVSGLETSYDILQQQKDQLGEAIQRVEEEVEIDDEFIDFFEEAKASFDAFEKELATLKEKANQFPQAGSILASAVDAKIQAISESFGTVIDWVDMAIEDTHRHLRRGSLLKSSKETQDTSLK